MAESKYAGLFFPEPRGEIVKEGKEGKVTYKGIFASSEMLGTKCSVRYSIVKDAHVNEALPHIHDFPMILGFVAANSHDALDFDADIEMYLGGEKLEIKKAGIVMIPSGVSHNPLIFRRVGKPFGFIEVMLTDKYSRRGVGEWPNNKVIDTTL
jgi:hypothetical protein